MADILYLAGPIDSVVDLKGKYVKRSGETSDSYIERVNWRSEVLSLMANEEGWITYDPFGAWTVGNRTVPDNKIAHINSVALFKASALLAHLPEALTAGTFMEMANSERMGIPVAWFGADMWADHWSLGLRGIQRVADAEEGVAYCIGNARSQSARQDDVTRLRIQRLHGEAQLPLKGFWDDAGLDVFISEDRVVSPGDFVDVPCGIAIEPPAGVWFRIVGRSSTFRKRRILVLEGIIDSGYRGELFVACTNLSDHPVTLQTGERIAQLIPQTGLYYLQPEWAEHLRPHPRGRQGFGSTGT